MSDTHRKIDRLILQQRVRKALPVMVVAALFIGFMCYALYVEYGPDADVVDIFPEME